MNSSPPAKYRIEYSVQFRRHTHTSHHFSDDPVAAKEFLTELLERGYRIVSVSHDGSSLNANEFDRLIRCAANLLAARHLCRSLDISTEEERYRFGFSG